jgi:hypothetical protein
VTIAQSLAVHFAAIVTGAMLAIIVRLTIG